MKPKPFSALNHLTVPCAILLLLYLPVGDGLARCNGHPAGFAQRCWRPSDGAGAQTTYRKTRRKHTRSGSVQSSGDVTAVAGAAAGGGGWPGWWPRRPHGGTGRSRRLAEAAAWRGGPVGHACAGVRGRTRPGSGSATTAPRAHTPAVIAKISAYWVRSAACTACAYASEARSNSSGVMPSPRGGTRSAVSRWNRFSPQADSAATPTSIPTMRATTTSAAATPWEAGGTARSAAADSGGITTPRPNPASARSTSTRGRDSGPSSYR